MRLMQGRIQGEGYKGQSPPFLKIILRMRETHRQIEACKVMKRDNLAAAVLAEHPRGSVGV